MSVKDLIQEISEALKKKDPERFNLMSDEELKKYSQEATIYILQKLLAPNKKI